MVQLARAADQKKGSWTAQVHLPGIKQLSAWTPQGILRRSASGSSLSSSMRRSRATSLVPSSLSKADQPDTGTSSEDEADGEGGDGEIKESLVKFLTGCYREEARRCRQRKSQAGEAVTESPEGTPSLGSTLTLTSESSEDDDIEDEEVDAADNDELLSLESHEDSLAEVEASEVAPPGAHEDGKENSWPKPDHVEPVEYIQDANKLERPLEDATVKTVQALADDTSSTFSATEDIHTLSFMQSKAGFWTDSDTEDLVACVPAVQCREVLVKGTLYLTTKRLVFYAWIALDRHEDETTVLMEGVLTFSYPQQKWRPNRRVYCVLNPYGTAYYNSAADRLHPLGARSLSAFKEISIDPDNPLRMKVEELSGAYRYVLTDTEENTRLWYNAMQAALFRYRYRSDHVVTSIPLSRIEQVSYEDILDFCKIVQIEVNCATEASPDIVYEHRQIVLGVSRQNWHILPQLEEVLENNKIISAQRNTIVLKEPEVIISFDSGERRGQVDDAQTSSKSFASDFVAEFGLEDKPEDLYITSVDVLRPYPDYGHIAVSRDYLCFWRKTLIGEDTKARVSLSTIEDVFPSKNFRIRVYSMTVQRHAARDMKFEFHSAKKRDECIEQIEKRLEDYQARHERSSQVSPHSSITAGPDTPTSTLGPPSPSTLSAPSISLASDSDITTSAVSTPTEPIEKQASLADPDIRIPTHAIPCLGTIVNLPTGARLRIHPRHFVLMTIGSRGDVQPYIALGKRLVEEGHKVTVASHGEYEPWVTSHGLNYKHIGGSPTALMQLSVEHKMFSPGFFRESLGKFRTWFDDLLRECWEACQDADVLIESPTAFAGIHIAEALAIPYFRAFTMPWTPTSSYPQAFAPVLEAGGAYNVLSYSIFDKILWQASSGQINRWRKKLLRVKSTTFERMQQRRIPFLYNFSRAVVPAPLDWSSLIHISGYWFLDQPDTTWKPNKELLEFISKAKYDGVPIVYAGFGSITIKNVESVIEHIYEAALAADVRVILSKGWSAREKDGSDRKIQLKDPPPNVYLVDSIPHDWLFPQIDAAMHHGGAGTTGASLRAGLPTIIKPFFGDQFFWSARVQRLGVGIKLGSLTASDISKAFTAATRNRIMQEKAEDIGNQIRAEDGCGDAIQFIYGQMSSAERYAKQRHNKSTLHQSQKISAEDDNHHELVIKATNRLKEMSTVSSRRDRSPSPSPISNSSNGIKSGRRFSRST